MLTFVRTVCVLTRLQRACCTQTRMWFHLDKLLEARELGRRRPASSGRGARDGREQPAADEPWLIRHISLAIGPGERVALSGPSGAGKTVLLRALAGLDPLDEGEVQLEGQRLAAYPMSSYRSRVVYVHQRPWIADESVEENLRLVFHLHVHRGKRYDRHRIERYLEVLQRPTAFLESPGPALSGGEQQMVALMRALQLGPQLLLLDEPTASLDEEAVAAVERLVSQWQQEEEARGVLWVTHRDDQRERVADRTIAIAAGRLVVAAREEVSRP